MPMVDLNDTAIRSAAIPGKHDNPGRCGNYRSASERTNVQAGKKVAWSASGIAKT